MLLGFLLPPPVACLSPVYGESVQVWRDLQSKERSKKARSRGPTSAAAAAAEEEKIQADQQFQDQVARARRMAEKGEQHPLYTAGQHVGQGEVEGVDVEEQLEGGGKRRPQQAAAAPAAEKQPTEEEIDATMRKMLKQRQARIAAEVAERDSNGSGRPPADDRWPIPTHMLEGGGAPGAGMSGSTDGVGMGMAGMMSNPALLQGGPPGFGGAATEQMRSRL